MVLVTVQRQAIRFEWVWRGLLCALLLFTGLASDSYRTLKSGTLEQLYADTRSGRAEVVEYSYRQNNRTYQLDVQWATGPFSWYRVSDNGNMSGPGPELVEAFPEDYKGPQGHTFREDFAAANSAGHVRVKDLAPTSDSGHWWASTYLGWWAAPAIVVSGGLLVLMLRTREHRYANRWAWFWMFLITPLGLIGYLLLERRPFPPERAPWTAKPMGGLLGFLWGVFVLPLLFTLLSFPFSYLSF